MLANTKYKLLFPDFPQEWFAVVSETKISPKQQQNKFQFCHVGLGGTMILFDCWQGQNTTIDKTKPVQNCNPFSQTQSESEPPYKTVKKKLV